MLKNQKIHYRSPKVGKSINALVILLLPVCFLFVAAGFLQHTLEVYRPPVTLPEVVPFTSNDGLREHLTEYFTHHNAAALIPIINCESEFKHFNEDGSVLRNREGSNAIGVAQIMSSVHPDPQVLKRYNRRHDTHFSPEDFDITSLIGNIRYALVLYEVRGVRDWECSKMIAG